LCTVLSSISPADSTVLAGTLQFTIPRKTLCDHCRGSGAASDSDIHTCKTCRGAGVTIQKAQIFPGMFTQMQATCNTCHGKGKTVAKPCPHCRGQKVVQSDNNLSFYLPPGAHEGFEMLFDGEADESPDWDIPGDVLVKVYAHKDAEWRRKDAGLYRREIIGVDEALLGFERNLTHLDGKTVRIARPGTTQPGHVDVIKGEGVSL
jgi:DnaJ-related protein SCJ1